LLTLVLGILLVMFWRVSFRFSRLLARGLLGVLQFPSRPGIYANLLQQVMRTKPVWVINKLCRDQMQVHEDVNRIKRKEYVERDDSSAEDRAASLRAWGLHKLRNDSKVVELFHGQFKSKLVCPTCQKVSVSFVSFYCRFVLHSLLKLTRFSGQ